MMKYILSMLLVMALPVSSVYANSIKELCEARALNEINRVPSNTKGAGLTITTGDSGTVNSNKPHRTIVYGAEPPVIKGNSYIVNKAEIQGPNYKANLQYTCTLDAGHTDILNFKYQISTAR